MFSILKIINHWKAFNKPSDPESMEGMFELITAMGYILEYIVFLNMIIPFFKALNNPPTSTIYEQLAQKEDDAEKERLAMFEQVVKSAQLVQMGQSEKMCQPVPTAPAPAQIVQMV